MKKSFLQKLAVVFSSAAVLGFATGCSSSSSGGADESALGENGGASVTMFVPDYAALYSDGKAARVVAPQTAGVKFGYNTGAGFVYLDVVSLSSAQKESVGTDAENAGVSGFNYTLEFSGIPCGTYGEDTLEVLLLDSDGNAVSRGTNYRSVEVVSESKASASFYTVPVSFDAESGSLSEGEMKFLKISLAAGQSADVTVSVDSGAYPDVVVFSADGSFERFIDISEENISFSISSASCSACYYAGVWANAESIASYQIAVSKSGQEHEFSSDADGSGSVSAVIDSLGGGPYCLNCGAHYDSEEEALSCSMQNGCPSYTDVLYISAGSYDISVAGGYTEQDALSEVQTVSGISVSSRIDKEYATLVLKGGVQQGTIKFTVKDRIRLVVTEVLGSNQNSLYGVAIASSDGTALYGGETVSLSSLPSSKNTDADISCKTLMLTAGTYQLGACQSSKNTKVSKLVFEEITE